MEDIAATIVKGILALGAVLVIVISAAALAVRAGRGKRLQNRTKEDLT